MYVSAAILSFTSACLLFAQAPQPTRIGPHRLGETFEEWAALSHELDNLDAVCRSRKREDKVKCKYLVQIRGGKLNEFNTGDDARSYKWKFIKGRLLEVAVSVPGPLAPASNQPSIPEEIGFLIQKYGQPTLAKTVPYQNYYGEKWDCLEDHWSMPDGAEITASEHIGNPAAGESPRRELLVLFSSKELLDSKTQSKPNPYDHLE